MFDLYSDDDKIVPNRTPPPPTISPDPIPEPIPTKPDSTPSVPVPTSTFTPIPAADEIFTGEPQESITLIELIPVAEEIKSKESK